MTTIVENRRVLDDITSLRHEDHQRGVVEVTRGPSIQARLQRLIKVSVQAHKIAARTEREPVELDSDSLTW
jgi:hypothetical protein